MHRRCTFVGGPCMFVGGPCTFVGGPCTFVGGLIIAIATCVGLSQSSLCLAQQLPEQFDKHLRSGEFAAARHQLQSLPGPQRDAGLASLAAAQTASGASTAASGTVRSIESPAYRQQAVQQTRQAAAGGGAFADYQSLIDLIQTTVVPDTWEALGGPSTMAPYPQGVYVDSRGTVQLCERLAGDDPVDQLRQLLKSPSGHELAGAAGAWAPETWRQPAAMRCVSLRRLNDEWTRRQMLGLPAGEALTHLAGLSRVQYVVIQDNDILLLGPVGGIEAKDGWYRDARTGLVPWRLDFLSTTLAASLRGEPFGCTIDPTTEGLQRAANVASSIASDQLPIGKAADAMVEALGMQRVEVFGTAGDTPIGYLMVEADRHMKTLALGLEPMPAGVPTYFDIVEATIEQGPPSELLLRLWFTAAARPIRASDDRTVIELGGTPLRLSGQNERAVASGQRGLVTHDPRSEQFVAAFNRRWPDIRNRYPVYAALESVYRAASVSETLRRFASEPAQRSLLESLAMHASSSAAYAMPAPRQVQSIATLHTIRQGRKRHHIVMASGGVAIDPRQAVSSEVADYPTLTSQKPTPETEPKLIQRWWWDLRG